MLSRPLLYFHTLRYLKPIQIYGRLLFRLRRPALDLRPAPDLRSEAGVWVRCARRPSMVFVRPTSVGHPADSVGPTSVGRPAGSVGPTSVGRPAGSVGPTSVGREDGRLKPALQSALQPALQSALQSAPIGFRFLSVTRESTSADDWNRADWPKLWLYNLHYFDDLNADDAASRLEWHRALMARWVAGNPPAAGNGWEPYPLSLRLVNWVKWAAAGNALGADATHSLAVQARWLMGRLEWHLLGNHLLANAKALVFAGTFFDGPQADAWRQQGLAILCREHAEQILEDGGHFERSPMYHAIILEDLLDLIQLALRWPGVIDAAMLAGWQQQAARMLAWLEVMTHPDGEIAFFNDAAIGIAPNLAALAAYAAGLGVVAGGLKSALQGRSAPGSVGPPSVAHPPVFVGPTSVGHPPAVVGPPSVAHPPVFVGPTSVGHSAAGGLRSALPSGYVRMEKGDAVLIADVGEIGPDYLPGHAHADTLSFELSVFGQRVVVNSGTSEYGSGAERLRQRGTAAHSTVQIDGADSSEVWSGFRVARRARPVGFAASEEGDAIEVGCGHDGYRRLPGRPLHRRAWRMTAQGLRVTDTVEGGFGEAVARFYLHPALSASGAGEGGLLALPDGHIMRWSVTGGAARVVSATWHPEFGQSIAGTCIELVFSGPQVTLEFSWA